MKQHHLPLQSPIRPFSVHSRQFSNEKSGVCPPTARKKVGFPRTDPRIDQIKDFQKNQATHDKGNLPVKSWFSVGSASLGDGVMGRCSDAAAVTFFVVRDDLVHPLINGNKARKLNTVLPPLEDCSVTDVVIRGGCQSAHTAAVGVIRLVYQLSQDHLLGKKSIVKLVVDSGTGTTAIGLALGASCLGLQWEITAVILADTADKYREHEKQLISEFRQDFAFNLSDCLDDMNGGIVQWMKRRHPRKFGNVIRGEIEVCRRVAQQTGVLVDPVYTLAAWEMATLLSEKSRWWRSWFTQELHLACLDSRRGINPILNCQ